MLFGFFPAVRERLQRFLHVERTRRLVVVKRLVNLGGACRDTVEAAVLDLERERLPECGDLGVGPAVLEPLRLPLGEVAREVEKARDRVAVGVIVAGEEVELAVGADRVRRTRRDAE